MWGPVACLCPGAHRLITHTRSCVWHPHIDFLFSTHRHTWRWPSNCLLCPLPPTDRSRLVTKHTGWPGRCWWSDRSDNTHTATPTGSLLCVVYPCCCSVRMTGCTCVLKMSFISKRKILQQKNTIWMLSDLYEQKHFTSNIPGFISINLHLHHTFLLLLGGRTI